MQMAIDESNEILTYSLGRRIFVAYDGDPEARIRSLTQRWRHTANKPMDLCGASVHHCATHVHVAFPQPHPVLSCAVFNGGFVEAEHLLNLKVSDADPSPENPESTLARYCEAEGWKGTTVGMMTAASMNSLRWVEEHFQDLDLAVLATAGLSHPRCAGDPADYREPGSSGSSPGTINVMVVTTGCLTPAAMVEAVMIVSEAKASAMLRLGIQSGVSSHIATGTGTDAIAMAGGRAGPEIRYCGKHVRFGERLGRAVIRAVTDSITRDR
jgi:adenosylcobinamide amidohydrolase